MEYGQDYKFFQISVMTFLKTWPKQIFTGFLRIINHVGIIYSVSYRKLLRKIYKLLHECKDDVYSSFCRCFL